MHEPIGRCNVHNIDCVALLGEKKRLDMPLVLLVMVSGKGRPMMRMFVVRSRPILGLSLIHI
eukprot:5206651-Prorocentrum_lima.AAC.1